MKYLDDIRLSDFALKEVSSQEWIVIFLGAKSAESEINSIIAKARNLDFRVAIKPHYLHPLNVVEDITRSFNSGMSMVQTLDFYVHNMVDSRNKNVAVVFNRDEFDSEDVFREVIQYLKYTPICLNSFTDYMFDKVFNNCEKDGCRDCNDLSSCVHKCAYRLICLLLNVSEIAKNESMDMLIRAVKNSYLGDNMNSIVTQTLDKHGIAYDLKKHRNDAFTCEDVSRERGVSLAQILKCMVGKDNNGNIYIMLIPGNAKLKIKKLRQRVGTKVELVSREELTISYGLTVGAISPPQFISNKKASFFMDPTVLNEERIDISAGSLDAGVHMNTMDLLDLIKPEICDIISSG